MIGDFDSFVAASEYATRGWRVLPIRKGEKLPRTPHGFKDATIDREQISAWYGAHPDDGVGIAMGSASGVGVLDVDPKNGGNESLAKLEAEIGPIPKTVTCLTGGDGRQFYLAYPKGIDLKRKLGILPGLDWLVSDGYVVAPPSLHPSGKRYAWAPGCAPSEIALALMPEALIRFVGTTSTSNSAKSSKQALGSLPEEQVRTIGSALECVDPNCDRDKWIRVGMALHDTHAGEQAFAIWDHWSSKATRVRGDGRSPCYPGTDGLRRQWASFARKDEEITLRSLFRFAQDGGWKGVVDELADGRTFVFAPGESAKKATAKPWIPCPLDAFPPLWRDAVHEMALRVGVDESGIAALSMAFISGAIGNARTVEVRPGYEQALAMWALLLQDSGSAKTYTLSAAAEGLESRDKKLRDESTDAAKKYAATEQNQKDDARRRKKVASRAKKQAKKLAQQAKAKAREAATKAKSAAADYKAKEKLVAKAKDPEAKSAAELAAKIAFDKSNDASVTAQAAKVAADAAMEATLDDGPEAEEVADEKPGVPPYKCAKISDASAEAVMFRLRDAPRGLTYCVDEASTLISSLGEYKKGGGGDHERLLRLKDGKPITVDRLRDNPDGSIGGFRIERGLMAVAAAGTPGLFLSSAKKVGGYDSGLVARFWLFSPPITYKPWIWNQSTGATPNLDKFRAIEDALANLDMPDGKPVVLSVTDSARAVWDEFYPKYKQDLLGRRPGTVRSFRAKQEGDTWRVAAIIHMVRSLAGEAVEAEHAVDGDSLRAAIKIMEWAAYEFERVLAMGQGLVESDDERRQRALVAWIASQPDGASVREVQNGGPPEFRKTTSEVLERQLRALVAAGRLTCEDVRGAHGPSVTRFRVATRQEAAVPEGFAPPVASQSAPATESKNENDSKSESADAVEPPAATHPDSEEILRDFFAPRPRGDGCDATGGFPPKPKPPVAGELFDEPGEWHD